MPVIISYSVSQGLKAANGQTTSNLFTSPLFFNEKYVDYAIQVFPEPGTEKLAEFPNVIACFTGTV